MTSQNLTDAMLNTLKMYFRMRAAVAIMRELDDNEFSGVPINFTNLPNINSTNNLLGYETAEILFSELFKQINDGHLSIDIFLRVISHLETFYSAKLTAKSLSPDGTLGGLQKRCEGSYGVTGPLVLEIDEIRERRNALMHHHGNPTAKYIAAAGAVFQGSGGAIDDPSTVSTLRVSDNYLAHCVNKIAAYSSMFV